MTIREASISDGKNHRKVSVIVDACMDPAWSKSHSGNPRDIVAKVRRGDDGNE